MKYIEPRVLKGFPDFLPGEQLRRQRMFSTIQSVFERFGFLPMSTPALEYKELLLNKYGDDEKLVYSFEDHGGRGVALRYDLTVPLARFVAMHEHELTFPFKRYQIGPVWRAENTQKGRLREFYQCDIDVVGTESELSDTEIIACLCQTLEELGISNYSVKVNDRGIFNLFASSFNGSMEQGVELIRAIDKFYKIGTQGVLDILSEKGFNSSALARVEQIVELGINQNALQGIRTLFPENLTVAEPIENLLKLLNLQGVPAEKVIFDPLIARGLDYYTGMVFELNLVDHPEFGSIGGGGRYNSLVDQFSKSPLPAVGGSLGIDRIFEALTTLGLLDSSPAITCVLLNMEASLLKDYIEIVTELRSNGISSELYYEPAKLEKQFKFAERKGAHFVVLLGEKEKAADIVTVKELTTRIETQIPRTSLVHFLKN